MTVLEFFKRITGVSWERSYEATLLAVRIALVASFVAIIVSDVAECQPFSHYWQVLPDPGGQCRQGYVQLLTMAVCNVITDLLLVFFPIPIIMRSQMGVKRKIQLVLLFSLSLGVVAVTIYRVPHIIAASGSQQSRSLYASVEILFATVAANALVLGSFVRDRGVKKRKYRHGSLMDSIDRSSGGSRSRRPTVRQWGSDEDLVRDMGLSFNNELRVMPHSSEPDHLFHPAPISKMADDMWQYSNERKSAATQSDDTLWGQEPAAAARTNSAVYSPRKVSFFDVGGLLEEDAPGGQRRESYLSSVDPIPSPSHNAPSPTLPAATNGVRRGSTALIQDLGGLLIPTALKRAHQHQNQQQQAAMGSGSTELQPIPCEPSHESQDTADLKLIDLGGLLQNK